MTNKEPEFEHFIFKALEFAKMVEGGGNSEYIQREYTKLASDHCSRALLTRCGIYQMDAEKAVASDECLEAAAKIDEIYGWNIVKALTLVPEVQDCNLFNMGIDQAKRAAKIFGLID